MKARPKDSVREFEQAAALLELAPLVLRLYVAGNTPASLRALANIKALCEVWVPGRYILEVIDVFQQPERARDDQVLAVPVLIKKGPPPLRRLLGDLRDREQVESALGLGLIQPRRSYAKASSVPKKQTRRR